MPSLHRSVGALAFPLADTQETDFASLDPARDILLNLLFAAINDELGPRWPDAIAGTTITSSTPVAQKLPFEPNEETLQQMRAKMPALFVYRDGANPVKSEDFTLSQSKYTARWGIDYFLGPLDVGERGKLGDILHAVGKLISEVIEAGGHSAYATQALDAGTIAKRVLGPWGPGTAGFSSREIIEYQAGAAALSKDAPKYWACSCVLETVELSALGENAYPNYYDGAQATLGTGTDAGTIDDLIVADTDAALDIWDP